MWFGATPIPLPKNYVSGLDVQRRDFEADLWSYLGGRWKRGGWWYYYIYASFVKLPLGVVLLFPCSIIGLLITRPAWFSSNIAAWLPALLLFIVASSQTGINVHFRYVLPALPFVFIVTSFLGSAPDIRWRPLLARICVTWVITSSIFVFPHSLSYFNELAGGPLNGDKHLINSNLDWGQDLFYLKRWMNRHPEIRNLELTYYGPLDPRSIGIQFALPNQTSTQGHGPRHLQARWYAISANHLRGHAFLAHDGKGTLRATKGRYDKPLVQNSPAARAGYSIFIYDKRRSPTQ